jgi:hypothetical protein
MLKPLIQIALKLLRLTVVYGNVNVKRNSLSAI